MSIAITDQTIEVGGIAFGTEDDNGTQWIFTKIDGWYSPPPSTSTTTDREGAHGAVFGQIYYSRRTITISGVVGCEDHLTAAQVAETLAGLCGDGELYQFLVRDRRLGDRWAYVQRGDFKIEWDGLYAVNFQLSFVAPDQRRYGDLHRVRAVLASGNTPSGGLTAGPEGLVSSGDGLDAGVDTRGEIVQVTNNGTFEADMQIELHAGSGGLIAPINIRNGLNGRVLTYNGNIPSGHYVLLDGGPSKGVLYDGYESRRELLTSALWSTIPAKTIVPFSWDHAGGASSGSYMQITTYDANL